MARRLPAQVPTRVVHYVDPALQTNLEQYAAAYVNPAEVIARQQRNTELYLRWKARQAEIRERDEKVRRFWVSFGAVVGLAFIAAVGVLGWLVWTFLASLSLGMFAGPVIVLIAGGLAFGGHRCITVVQHWH